MNYRALLIGLVLAVFVPLGLQAQEDLPPPPAPLIYDAPNASELKVFISVEEKFQVTFPGTPGEESAPTQEGITAKTFSTKRKGSSSTVVVWHFSQGIKVTIDELFKIYKDSILTDQAGKRKGLPDSYLPQAISEEKFKLEDFEGREFVYHDTIMLYKARIVLVGDKIYEIRSNVTNYHILKQHHPARLADFEKETTRFFDSFKFVK